MFYTKCTVTASSVLTAFRSHPTATGLLLAGLMLGFFENAVAPSEMASAAIEEVCILAFVGGLFLVFSDFSSEDKKTKKKKGYKLDAVTTPEATVRATAQEIEILSMKCRAALETGDLDTAEEAMQCMQDAVAWPGQEAKSAWSLCYTQLIHASARMEHADKAEKWLLKFAAAAPAIHPTTSCANAALGALAATSATRAEALLRRMPSLGTSPDEESYETVFQACMREGDTRMTMRCLSAMRRQGVRLREECYHGIQSWLKQALATRWPEKEMSLNPDAPEWTPQQTTCTTRLTANAREWSPTADWSSWKPETPDDTEEAEETWDTDETMWETKHTWDTAKKKQWWDVWKTEKWNAEEMWAEEPWHSQTPCWTPKVQATEWTSDWWPEAKQKAKTRWVTKEASTMKWVPKQTPSTN